MLLLILPIVAIVSWLGTAALRRYALSNRIIDTPNARSSHAVPTPRGGGMAIVAVFLLAIAGLYQEGMISLSFMLALMGGGGLVAVIGFLDDHQHIAARWRLLGHFAAAGWGLYWLGGLAPLELGSFYLGTGIVMQVLAVFYLVWLLNLYNFMDGIDGIAGLEAISVALGGAFLYVLTGAPIAAWVPVLLSSTVLGFLLWNMPPARIFMGDAGSGFLGIVFGLLSLQAAWVNPKLFWSWLILLGVFVVDATWTLIRRLLNGEKLYEAHRSHAYQWASRRFSSHKVVTLGVAALNLFWLLPCALLVACGYLPGFLGLFLAYVPLCVLAVIFKAGVREL
ncbi:Fuc2NAc and GlcNAc transferase [Pseudomonas duriflava]|uniref:Fuc2NAc and GlcNAc transferase n=1 Tax=Pseudomonas duriflava TaxID=459528 RepID=A0A562PRL4_9PSED|nr:glycosyltransferase family 4 protein [Pseudomonas duriflava]TWI47028.1 Fuc2NAc and GlcNAc transferase [Pseudomonas duriflava]